MHTLRTLTRTAATATAFTTAAAALTVAAATGPAHASPAAQRDPLPILPATNSLIGADGGAVGDGFGVLG
ncbi:hypothetical protein ACQEU3_45080 [Spirillospora sp. CA-253888]